MKTLVDNVATFGAWLLTLPLLQTPLLAESVQHKALAKTSASATSDTSLFSLIPPTVSGITHVNRMNVDHPMSYLYHSGMTCGGVAVADFDGDGRPDIFFAGTTDSNRLYRQIDTFKFEDITATSGPGLDGGNAWSAGVSAVDINGDGRIDIYVNNYMQPNQLFLNMGKGKDGAPVTFRECAKEAGLDVVDCSHSTAFADYDGDGRLDAYVLTNRIEDPDGAQATMPIVPGSLSETELPKILPEKERYYRVWRYDAKNWGTEAVGTPDYLFRQTGVTPDGIPHFENTTTNAGISGYGDGLSVTWWDPDNDGDPDLYIANDFIEPDAWYENNGDGTFTNVLRERVPHTPWFSMGAGFGDVNGDGQLDLLVADMSSTSHFKSKTTMGVMGGIPLKRALFDNPPQLMRNALYLSNGTQRYEEAAFSYKVSSTDWTWAVKFADYDLDGWEDVYFTNGISRHMNDSDLKLTEDMLVGKHLFEFFKEGEMRREKNRAYRNEHGEKFVEMSDEWGLGAVSVSYGSALADLDGDGDPDLVTVNLEEPVSIYRNNAQNPNRLSIELQGEGANSQGLNATLRLTTSQGTQTRHISPVTGYLSSNQATALFGFAKDTEIQDLSIHWPHGGIQKVEGLKAGQHYTIKQQSNSPRPQNDKTTPLFANHEALELVNHRDSGWDLDFSRPNQSLLPWAFSQLGPALACADVDGDGDTDFYLGGSAGEIGQLRINQGGGRFAPKMSIAFADDSAYEDAGAVFFDVEGDGDADLLVASGSNEFDPGSPNNRDRLYLNDGKGNYSEAKGALPEDSLIASAVTAADFDRDGDLDVFIGTRLKAWSYPLSEPSRLLVNESTGEQVKFAAAPSEMMPDLGKLGMITSAIAVDLDRDGWVDLLTTSEWGPLRWFRNEKGRLLDQSEKVGLAGTTGFWNSLTVADFDHDGDLDIAAGNIGLNTKYKQPSADRPHLAYYGDFDGKGANLVEVKREGQTLYPERGRSCSSNAMPFIKEKFGTFKAFALAELTDIYSEEKLAKARKYSITEFQSGIFINQGSNFTFTPLPRAAQIAPVFGLSAGDFTGDGHPDLILSGNFKWGPQNETGPFDGGLGLVLEGNGKGSFTPLPASRSGLQLVGDHRALARIDLNDDQRPDFLAAVNNGPLRALELADKAQGRWLAVRLPLNRSAGATLTFKPKSGPPQTAAFSLGGGYWSQEESTVWFGLGDEPPVSADLEIKWADGTSSHRKWNGKDSPLQITKQ